MIKEIKKSVERAKRITNYKTLASTVVREFGLKNRVGDILNFNVQKRVIQLAHEAGYKLPVGFSRNGIKKYINNEITKMRISRKVAQFHVQWAKTNPMGGLVAATPDGKLLLQMSNSAINKIMTGKYSKTNMKSFKNVLKQANKQMMNIKKGVVDKRNMVNALRRIAKKGDLTPTQISNINNVIKDLRFKDAETTLKILSQWENTEDWYEENKEDLQEAKGIKDRIFKRIEKNEGKVVYSKDIDALQRISDKITKDGKEKDNWVGKMFDLEGAEKYMKENNVKSVKLDNVLSEYGKQTLVEKVGGEKAFAEWLIKDDAAESITGFLIKMLI